jgi:Zn-dependent M28 family amino/carboxypeptidase
MRPSVLALATLVLACSDGGVPGEARNVITAENLAAHIQVLASDEFGGRAPASPGEEQTVSYLRDQFIALDLQPGNGESYYQEVPLVAITGRPGTLLTRGRRGASDNRFVVREQFVAWTKRVVDQVSLENSGLVFVGYGIVAPEYQWNDYAGVDVRGKTVVILVNDPGFATGDTTFFHGRSMTYYGRWTYKFEEAARRGAAGAFVVHETEPAGYPWEVVRNSWTGPQFSLASRDNNMSRAQVEGWITTATARSIARQAGLDYDSLRARAARRGFKAVPVDVRVSLTVRNAIARSNSRNVLAVLPGSEHPDEYLVYSAHWDHFGTDPSIRGDGIMNGARDNASGVAALLTIARAFTALPQRPLRSILFLAVTAEEQGLLGSQYYATNPVYPLNKTIAVINMDGMNIWGRTRDVTVVGYGNSELDDYLEDAAKEQGRVVRPDPEPEKGYFYRSDHFSFAKEGVPALNPEDGIDNREHGEAWGRQQREAWIAEKYHKPSDQYEAGWDLSGAAEDAQLYFAVGYRLAREHTFPNWREGNEFRAKRDAMMK